MSFCLLFKRLIHQYTYSSLQTFLKSDRFNPVPHKFFIIPLLIFSLTPGFYFGQVLDTFGKYDFFNHPSEVTSNVTVDFTKDSLFSDGMVFFYVMIGISAGAFIFAFLQLAFFNTISENFVFRIRKLLFQKILFKDMQYFDQPTNKPGQLSIKLRSDTSIVRVLVSTYLGSILQALSSFLIGIIFGFVYSWRMTLLVIALSPGLFFSGLLESLMMYGRGLQSASEDQNLVQETFNNIKVR